MEIYLLRHGATPGNEKHRYIGRTDEPLSERGRAVLKACREPGADHVYVTPLRRTVQTAERIFPGLKQVEVSGFTEMNFGVFEGRSAFEMEDDALYREWVDGGCNGAPPEGEDKDAFALRCRSAFADLVKKELSSQSDRMLIVCHGGTIGAIMSGFLKPEPAFFAYMPKNGCGYLLQAEEDASCLLNVALAGELCFVEGMN